MEKKNDFSAIMLALLKACLYILAWLAISYATSFLAVIMMRSANPNITGEALNKLYQEKSELISLLSNCITLVVFMAFYHIRKKSVTEKINLYTVHKRYLYNSLFLGLGAQFVVLIILSLIPMPESWTNQHVENYGSITESALTFTTVVTVAIIAPIVEEIIFRGLVLNRLSKVMNKYVAIVLSALAFGAVHGEAIAFIYATLIGLLLGYVFTKFDSVLPCVFFHVAFNITSLWLSENFAGAVPFIVIGVGIALFGYSLSVITKYKR